MWALALLCFLLPCGYWYVRNAVMTGDPFNPIGASLFGFTNWTAADYKEQFYDVRVHAALPNPLIWPVLLAPFCALRKRSAAVRAALVFCAWSLVGVGADLALSALSHGVLSAARVDGGAGLAGALRLGREPRSPGCGRPPPGCAGTPGFVGRWLAVLLLAALAAVSMQQTARKVAMISPTPATRDAFLRAHVPGYAVMRYLRAACDRPRLPGRSERSHLLRPQSDLGRLARPLALRRLHYPSTRAAGAQTGKLGFQAIVITSALAPGLSSQPGFDDHFALMYRARRRQGLSHPASTRHERHPCRPIARCASPP